jgi:two-component system response regulator YesN
VQKLERLLGCSMFVAAGTIVEQPELLHESYAAADRAFGYRLLTCESIWNYADIALRKGGRSVCSQEEELALSAILLDNNPLQLSSWVKERIQAQLDDPQTTIESLRAYMQSIAISAHRWLERALEATGQAPSAALDGDRASPAAQSGVSLRDALFQRLHAVMQLYHTQLAGGQAAHVQRAMAYIEQHIGGDVGLQHVAKHVHLHPNHLSEVFKKEAGMTFGDYVTKLKMKRAMEILTGTPAKVSEVAAQVGYEDVKYFSQLFKKTTGRTPSEFRGESARHEES